MRQEQTEGVDRALDEAHPAKVDAQRQHEVRRDCGEYGARAVRHQPDEKVEDGGDGQVAAQRAQHFCLDRRRAIHRLGTCGTRKTNHNTSKFFGPRWGAGVTTGLCQDYTKTIVPEGPTMARGFDTSNQRIKRLALNNVDIAQDLGPTLDNHYVIRTIDVVSAP